MTTPSEDALDRANEADVVEQSQELDGAGTVSDGPDVSPDEANVADAVEQGANLTTDDDDAYPHQTDGSDD